MQIQITSSYETESATYVSAFAGKTEATVGVFDDGRIWVGVSNASSRAYSGRFPKGKSFASLSDAIKAYKSAAAKAIISEAAIFAAPKNVIRFA